MHLTKFKYPELLIALFFNGSLFYFYIMYRTGQMPRTEITALFYGMTIIFAVVGLFIRKYSYRTNLIDIIILLFIVWTTASFFLFSTNNSAALKKLLYGPLLFIAPFCAGRLFHNIFEWNKFVDYVLLLTKILLIIFTIELMTSYNQQLRLTIISFGENVQDNPILVGFTFSIGFLILYNKLISSTNITTSLYSSIWLMSFLFFIIKAASRGVILSLISTLLLLHLLKGIRFKQVVVISMLLASGLIIFLNLSEDTIKFYSSSVKVSEKTMGDINSTDSTTIRLSLWNGAIQNFVENPVIGVGFANSDMSSQMKNTSDPIYPHNIFLEIASELGFIGLVLFIIPLLIGLKRSYYMFRQTRTKEYIQTNLLLLFLVFTLIEAQFSGFLTNQAQLLFMMGITGGLYQWDRIPQCSNRKKIRKLDGIFAQFGKSTQPNESTGS
jgi:O-antigen ligase